MIASVQVNVRDLKFTEEPAQFFGGEIAVGKTFFRAVQGDEGVGFDLFEFRTLISKPGDGDKDESSVLQDSLDFPDHFPDHRRGRMVNHLNRKHGFEKPVGIRQGFHDVLNSQVGRQPLFPEPTSGQLHPAGGKIDTKDGKSVTGQEDNMPSRAASQIQNPVYVSFFQEGNEERKIFVGLGKDLPLLLKYFIPGLDGLLLSWNYGEKEKRGKGKRENSFPLSLLPISPSQRTLCPCGAPRGSSEAMI